MEETKGKQPAASKGKAQDKDPKQQPAEVKPKDVMKGNRVLIHRLFESSVTDCLKNVSYQPKKPKLEEVPHKHFFHTIDSRGKKLTQSSILLNHYHNMEWGMDPETGELYAKSGPPMRMTVRKLEGGEEERVEEQVHWMDNKGKAHMDKHTHTWEYMDSEEFTANSMEARRKEQRITTTASPLQTAEPFNASDPATIREA